MAIARIPLPEASVSFAGTCKEWLPKAAQQKALAREMIERSRMMRNRAVEMAKMPSLRRSLQ